MTVETATRAASTVLAAYAAHLGIPVHDPPHADYPMWDGTALKHPSDPEDWAHEIAHWILADPARRRIVDYGWGHDAQFGGRDDDNPDKLGPLPWPDPDAEWPPTQEEIDACVLGFAMLVRVGVDATPTYDLYGFFNYRCHFDGLVLVGRERRLEQATYADRRKVQPHVVEFTTWLARNADGSLDRVLMLAD